MPQTELPGNVVRWGQKEPSAAKCCEDCLKNSRCTVWVYCDFAACGEKRGECWLKEMADPYTDIDLVRGRSDLWTAGTRDPPPPQGSNVTRAAVAASEAHLALVTEFGRIRLRLRPKSPKAVAWVEGLLDQHGDCTGCTFYRAEPVPKHWGSLEWPDTYSGGRWGPPYALLQGGLSAQGAHRSMVQNPGFATADAATQRSLEAHPLAQGCPLGPRGEASPLGCRSERTAAALWCLAQSRQISHCLWQSRPQPRASREDNPVVRRGMVAWAGGACGPAFFVALADHPEWGRGHTVFADVVGEDMPVVERIVAQPAKTGTGSIPITNLITPIKISLERLKSGPLFE